jgi:hypothetical protein
MAELRFKVRNPMLFMQVINPPIIRIPPPPEQPWYESAFFLAAIGFCVTFFLAGVGMTTRGIFTHVFFVLSWVCGSFSLWIVCKNVFQKKKLACWALMAMLLGIFIGAADLAAIHIGK